MPCNSDYLDPTQREAELQRTARLILYVCEKMGLSAPRWVEDVADDPYPKDERPVPYLCSLLKELPLAVQESVVYDAHDSRSRDLANWWETHLEADARREAEEREEAYHATVVARAKAKLTPEELRALGVN